MGAQKNFLRWASYSLWRFLCFPLKHTILATVLHGPWAFWVQYSIMLVYMCRLHRTISRSRQVYCNSTQRPPLCRITACPVLYRHRPLSHNKLAAVPFWPGGWITSSQDSEHCTSITCRLLRIQPHICPLGWGSAITVHPPFVIYSSCL